MKARVTILVVFLLFFVCACAPANISEPSETEGEVKFEGTKQLQEADELEQLSALGIGIHEDAWGTLRDDAELWAGKGEWLYRSKGNIGPYDTVVTFYFNDVGLYGCEHRISGTEDKTIKFDTLDTFLSESYGEATSTLFYTGDQKQMLSSYEEACENNGFVQKVWKLENTIIYLKMKADSSVYVEIVSLREVE